MSLPMSFADQYTRIESLNVNHECTVDDLLTLLSYTLRLRRLHCESITESTMAMTEASLTAIPGLTCIFIAEWEADIQGFEALTTKIGTKLKCLEINCSKAADFLNAERWERILSQHLPHLSTFDFKYEEYINHPFVVTEHHERLHLFYSPFWLQNPWSFRMVIDVNDCHNSFVQYLIYKDMQVTSKDRPEKSNLFGFSSRKKNSTFVDQELPASFPTIPSEGNQLSVHNLPDFNIDRFYLEMIGPVLRSSHVTSLSIDFDEILAGVLIDLTRLLPHLRSLVVHSIAPIQERRLSGEESRTLRIVSKRRSISNVRLISVTRLREIRFLIDLCPGMHCLQIDDMNDIDLSVFVRFILMKNVQCLPNLFSICFGSAMSNVGWLKKLDKMIGIEQRRRDYAIEQIQEKIYLRWTV